MKAEPCRSPGAHTSVDLLAELVPPHDPNAPRHEVAA